MTAKARQRYENVGRGVASYGRKEKETAKRTQMFVGPDDDDEGVVYYKIPTRMTRSQKKPHLLSDAINNNYSASHKHDKTMF